MKSLLTYLFLLFALNVQAATHTAASASRADVGTAYTACSDGDILAIPSGTATWTTILNITKAIVLQGNGVGNTIIKDGVTSGALMTWTLVAGQPSRMTGIEFSNDGRISQSFSGIISFTGLNNDSSTIRVDNCKFDHLNGLVMDFQSVVGVVDNNVALYTPTSRLANVYGTNWNGGTYAASSWTDTDHFGTSQSLYFENNTLTYDSATYYAHIDSWAGGRWVARYNTIVRGWLECHGTDSAGRLRGARAVEIYSNTFAGDDVHPYVVNMRSGAGLIYNNVATAYALGAVLELSNYRNSMSFTPWQGADGTNQWDSNTGGGPFGASPFTVSSGTGLTVTVTGAGWSTNQWAGYSLKKTSGLSVSSLTRSGSTATVTTGSAHGYTTGDIVTILGASPIAYNITASITVTGTDTFTYGLNFGSTPTTPATGTIKATLGCDFSEVLSNTSDTMTFLATGYGSQYDLRFTASDTFNIWRVAQALDQPGVSGGSLITGDDPVLPGGWNDQTADPSYEWNNTYDGSNLTFAVGAGVLSILEGVNFFRETAKPGYAPYPYPHPLRGESSGTPRYTPRAAASLLLRRR